MHTGINGPDISRARLEVITELVFIQPSAS